VPLRVPKKNTAQGQNILLRLFLGMTHVSLFLTLGASRASSLPRARSPAVRQGRNITATSTSCGATHLRGSISVPFRRSSFFPIMRSLSCSKTAKRHPANSSPKATHVSMAGQARPTRGWSSSRQISSAPWSLVNPPKNETVTGVGRLGWRLVLPACSTASAAGRVPPSVSSGGDGLRRPRPWLPPRRGFVRSGDCQGIRRTT